MSGLDLFALIVLFVIVASVLVAVVVLARLPGQIAKKRGHPQAEAIGMAGWLSLLVAGTVWPLTLIWAYSIPRTGDTAIRELQDRVAALEARLPASLEAAQ